MPGSLGVHVSGLCCEEQGRESTPKVQGPAWPSPAAGLQTPWGWAGGCCV